MNTFLLAQNKLNVDVNKLNKSDLNVNDFDAENGHLEIFSMFNVKVLLL